MDCSASEINECPAQQLPPRGRADLQVVIIKGSQWDIDQAQEVIASKIKIAESLIGLNLTPAFAWVDAPEAVDGFGIGEMEKGIPLINRLGESGRPTLVFTGRKIPFLSQVWYGFFGRTIAAAVTFEKGYLGSQLVNEGVVFLVGEENLSGVTVAHEMGHLLARQGGHSKDPNEIMYAPNIVTYFLGMKSGCNFSEPWFSAVLTSDYVNPYTLNHRE